MLSPSCALAEKKACPLKMHVPVSAVFSIVSIKEKSDRNCPERANRTSVRISLMLLLYRSHVPMSIDFLNEIPFT
jgi:hypothetical protein